MTYLGQVVAYDGFGVVADEAAETDHQSVDVAERVAAIAEEQSLALGETYVDAEMLTMRAEQLSALFERYRTDSRVAPQTRVATVSRGCTFPARQPF
jgi:hypothetical protein